MRKNHGAKDYSAKQDLALCLLMRLMPRFVTVPCREHEPISPLPAGRAGLA